jgi:protocatechuate 3,4-dioxygenase beta subunit
MQHEELLRTDISDGMDGVPLLLDVGVMDVTTCTPLENALVDVCEFLRRFL